MDFARVHIIWQLYIESTDSQNLQTTNDVHLVILSAMTILACIHSYIVLVHCVHVYTSLRSCAWFVCNVHAFTIVDPSYILNTPSHTPSHTHTCSTLAPWQTHTHTHLLTHTHPHTHTLPHTHSSLWDHVLSLDIGSQVAHIHCHRSDDSAKMILIGYDGIAYPRLIFSHQPSLFQFLECLENNLLPRGSLEPPLWYIKAQTTKVGYSHTHTHAHTYTHMHTLTHSHTQTCTHTHTCIHAHTHTCM